MCVVRCNIQGLYIVDTNKVNKWQLSVLVPQRDVYNNGCLSTGACLPFGVATNNDAYCFRSHEPDTSCGVPAKVRWYYNQYTGVCTTYRTCSPPNKVYVNDFSSRERCERTCVQRGNLHSKRLSTTPTDWEFTNCSPQLLVPIQMQCYLIVK